MFQPRPHQPRFTDEQMIEIGRAREKLEAIRNKCQPYPDEQVSSSLDQSLTLSTPEPQWARGQWDRVEQLQGQMLHLESKVIELLARRKPRGQY